jgi:two-component system sensor histidine kinase HupT/HoxJ
MKGLGGYLDALHEGAPAGKRRELRQSLRVDAILGDLQPLLEGTLEGAVRVTDIVKNLRRLSHSGAGERQTLDLAKIARTAASLTAGGRTARAEVLVSAEGEAYVVGPEGPLHQVIVNLVDNALYAVRDCAQARVEIKVARRGDWVELAVADNGPGIAPADLAKIFEPFFTTKPVGEGTGLGLWISFSIVRECGGSIAAANRAEGGAEFVIRLPAG